LLREEVVGGGYEKAQGGYGGGSTGGSGDTAHGTAGGGGSQSTGGAAGVYDSIYSGSTVGGFGYGGSGRNNQDDGGGGGGWFGGGGKTFGSGGGGSGYVLTASSYKPSGYLLGLEYYLSNAQTIAGNQSFPKPGGGTETGHSGNGYARITLVE